MITESTIFNTNLLIFLMRAIYFKNEFEGRYYIFAFKSYMKLYVSSIKIKYIFESSWNLFLTTKKDID
jgi:hypothetical protein